MLIHQYIKQIRNYEITLIHIPQLPISFTAKNYLAAICLTVNSIPKQLAFKVFTAAYKEHGAEWNAK